MVDVVLSKYDGFNIYAPPTRTPNMVYIEYTDTDDDEPVWEYCPVVKILDYYEDYDDGVGYNEDVDKVILEADGVTGEIIGEDYIIYIEADNSDGSTHLDKKPQLNIVSIC